MNIIAGNLRPDTGDIFWNENFIPDRKYQQAQKIGISIVHQERSLADSCLLRKTFSAVDKPVNAFGMIEYAKLYKRTQALLEQLQLKHISPKTIVVNYPPPQKQMVEIAKALAQKPSLLI